MLILSTSFSSFLTLPSSFLVAIPPLTSAILFSTLSSLVFNLPTALSLAFATLVFALPIVLSLILETLVFALLIALSLALAILVLILLTLVFALPIVLSLTLFILVLVLSTLVFIFVTVLSLTSLILPRASSLLLFILVIASFLALSISLTTLSLISTAISLAASVVDLIPFTVLVFPTALPNLELLTFDTTFFVPLLVFPYKLETLFAVFFTFCTLRLPNSVTLLYLILSAVVSPKDLAASVILPPTFSNDSVNAPIGSSKTFLERLDHLDTFCFLLASTSLIRVV